MNFVNLPDKKMIENYEKALTHARTTVAAHLAHAQKIQSQLKANKK